MKTGVIASWGAGSYGYIGLSVTDPDPRGVQVMPDGGVLVADAANRLVLRMDSDGQVGAGAYTSAQDDRSSSAPVCARRLDDGTYLIVDRDAQRVFVVGLNGGLRWQYGTTGVAGSGVDQLSSPTYADVRPDGNIVDLRRRQPPGDRRPQVRLRRRASRPSSILWQYGATGVSGTGVGPAGQADVGAVAHLGVGRRQRAHLRRGRRPRDRGTRLRLRAGAPITASAPAASCGSTRPPAALGATERRRRACTAATASCGSRDSSERARVRGRDRVRGGRSHAARRGRRLRRRSGRIRRLALGAGRRLADERRRRRRRRSRRGTRLRPRHGAAGRHGDVRPLTCGRGGAQALREHHLHLRRHPPLQPRRRCTRWTARGGRPSPRRTSAAPRAGPGRSRPSPSRCPRRPPAPPCRYRGEPGQGQRAFGPLLVSLAIKYVPVGPASGSGSRWRGRRQQGRQRVRGPTRTPAPAAAAARGAAAAPAAAPAAGPAPGPAAGYGSGSSGSTTGAPTSSAPVAGGATGQELPSAVDPCGADRAGQRGRRLRLPDEGVRVRRRRRRRRLLAAAGRHGRRLDAPAGRPRAAVPRAVRRGGRAGRTAASGPTRTSTPPGRARCPADHTPTSRPPLPPPIVKPVGRR